MPSIDVNEKRGQCKKPVVKIFTLARRDVRLVRPPQAMELYKTVLQHLALIAAVAGHLSQVSLQNSDNSLILTIQPTFAVDPKKAANRLVNCFCDPGEARTLDPMIKSHLLYQLSYGVIRSRRVSNTFAKVVPFSESANFSAKKVRKNSCYLPLCAYQWRSHACGLSFSRSLRISKWSRVRFSSSMSENIRPMACPVFTLSPVLT